MRVKAAVCRTIHRPLTVEDLDLDDHLRPDEILVRLVASGVCEADRLAIGGGLPMTLPFVPGREGAGIVERVGSGVTFVTSGDTVVLCSRFCEPPEGRDEDPNPHPGTGRRPDGAMPLTDGSADIGVFFFGQSSFSTYLICRASCAVSVPDNTPLELAAALTGDLLTGAAVLLQALEPEGSGMVVIAGGSAIGLLACMVATAQGATTIVFADPDEATCQRAMDAGATITTTDIASLPISAKSLVADGARFALVASGDETAIAACLESLGPQGRCAVLGRAGAAVSSAAPLDQRLVSAEAGSDARSALPKLLQMVSNGLIPLEQLITFYPFEHVNDALESSEADGPPKAVLRFSVGTFGELDRAMTEEAAAGSPDASVPSEDVEAPVTAPPVTAA